MLVRQGTHDRRNYTGDPAFPFDGQAHDIGPDGHAAVSSIDGSADDRQCPCEEQAGVGEEAKFTQVGRLEAKCAQQAARAVGHPPSEQIKAPAAVVRLGACRFSAQGGNAVASPLNGVRIVLGFEQLVVSGNEPVCGSMRGSYSRAAAWNRLPDPGAPGAYCFGFIAWFSRYVI
jgi:hypothetical protein